MDISEEQRRIKKSGIDKAFDPQHPISAELFCGRDNEVKSIIEAIMLKEGHAVIYGDRGVGKTSLSKYCGNHFAQNGKRVFYFPCSDGDTFSSIVTKLFSLLNITIEKTETTESGISVAYVFGILGKKTTKSSTRIEIDKASGVAMALRSQEGIIVIDEFDTLTNVEDKKKIAQLMKLLSDDSSNIQLLLVGISHDVNELLGGHASVVRSLTEVPIPRMSEYELHAIIQKGEDRTGLKFDNVVKDKIVKMSLGFPYYTHSLAFESAKNAVLDERTEITLDDLKVGTQEAISKVDQSLKSQYKNSIGVNEPLLKKQLLYCAAIIGNQGSFTMTQWINKYKDIYKKEIQNITISSQMQQVINKGTCMLKSLRKGEYVFTNSLMPSYINILGKP